MADQGRWFKLWISSKDDPSLSLLPISDYGRWCKLGVYTKEHGTDGTVSLSKPSDETIAHPLQSLFQVPHFDAVIDVIRRLPNIEISTVSLVTFASVSFEVRWHNWWKYQGDFSTDRVKRFREKTREMKRSKKRREEKRREENKEDTPCAPSRDPRVRTVIDFYHQVFLERFGAPPTINGGKCGAVAKRLLTGRSLEDVQWLIREHMERPPDLYERKRLYGLEHVLSAANTLLARRAERRP